MKKMLLCVVFVIIAHEAFSQYLVKKDIDIFIKEYDNFNNIFNRHEPSAKDEAKWDDFRSSVSAFYNILGNPENYIKDQRSFEKIFFLYKQSFQDMLNYKIPRELDDAFRKAGWKNDGNIKYWTICYGSFLLIITSELELLLGMAKDEFNPEDLDEDDEDEWKELTDMCNKISANVSRLLELINVNDKKIIEERLVDLVDVLE